MPANIATIGGQAAIAAYGETPWHGLGQKLEQPATAAEVVAGSRFPTVSLRRAALVRQNRRVLATSAITRLVNRP